MDFHAGAGVSRRAFLELVGGAGFALASLPQTIVRAAASDIQVAVIVDTVGAGAVYGTSVLNGMRLALDEINRSGGVKGRVLTFRVSDGRSDVTRITRLMRRACLDPRIVALVGPTLSSEAVVVDPLAQAAGLPVLAVSNTVPGLTAIGNCIFRIPLGDDRIIPVVLRTARARLHFKRVAVLYDDVNAATAGAGKVFLSSSAAMGLSVVAQATFSSGATQYGALLQTIKSANPDAILVSALAQDAGRILTQRLEAGIPATIPIIGANGLNTPAIIQDAGHAAEGVIVGTSYLPDSTLPRNRHFKAAFTQRYHHAPDAFAAQGYDGIFALATGLRRTDATINRRTVRAALARLTNVPAVLSPTGHFGFTAQREANLVPTVRIVRNGRFVRFP